MSPRRSAPRRRSREAALQVLYALDLARGSRSGAPPNPEQVFEGVAGSFDLQEGARTFAAELVAGVDGCRHELDTHIARCASNWRVSRMGAVDRNVLRLATYELQRTDTPTEVVIDEAVELARRFGTERSPGFVNGVLDAIVRTVRSGSARSSSA